MKVNKFKEEEKWVNEYNNPIKPVKFKPKYLRGHLNISKEVKALFWPIIK